MKRNYSLVFVGLIILLSFSSLAHAGLSFESEIPVISPTDITIDGDPSDWEALQAGGVQLYALNDTQGDNNCGVGTDIKAYYLARDDTHLYWRLDTYSGNLASDLNGSQIGPVLLFYEVYDPPLDPGVWPNGITMSLIGNSCCGYLSVRDDHGDWKGLFGGPEYGTIGTNPDPSAINIAEGKIPLNLFDNFTIEFLSAYIWYAPDADPQCDEVSKNYHNYSDPKQLNFFVQHRVYEDGQEFDRMNFWVYRGHWSKFVTEDLITNVTLIDPDGIEENILDFKYNNYRIAFTGYDCNSGQWTYPFDQNGELFKDYAEYTATLKKPLKVGEYTLEAEDIYGNTYSAAFQFYGQEELPIPRASSFKKKFDRHGNFIWEWDVPYLIDPALNTSVRAMIFIYKGSEWTALLYPTVSTHQGRLFIPKHVVEKMLEEGDRAEIQIQLRTNDNNNRSFSKLKRAKFGASKKPFKKGDDDDDDEDDDEKDEDD